jgi:NADH-quinone oxidoreductase subunit C
MPETNKNTSKLHQDISTLVESINIQFPGQVSSFYIDHNQANIHIKPEQSSAILKYLKFDEHYIFLVDLTVLDNLKLNDNPDTQKSGVSDGIRNPPERFCVVYHLRNWDTQEFLRVKAYLPEANPRIASVNDLWRGADWLEREVYDMFGIVFEGHPNLKRILCPDTMKGFPLRKDYPVEGLGERDEFPKYSEIPPE